MRYRLIAAFVLFLAVFSAGSVHPGETEDPWRGKHVDADGRMVAGGYDTNSSASVSYDPKSGEIERDWEEGPDSGKVKKIKLKVVVDEQNLVSDWSVSPKKYMKDG